MRGRGRGSQSIRFDTELDIARAKYQAGERATPRKLVLAESDIQSATLELLQRHPRVAFAQRVNRGAGWLVPNTVYQRLLAMHAIHPGEARYQTFGIPGESDLAAMLRGNGRKFVAECKTRSGVVSDDQRIYLEAVNAGGGLGIVVRDPLDVMRALAEA